MKLFESYIKEREGFELIQNEDSFVTYKIRDGECFIGHIYVKDDVRQGGKAKLMVKRLIDIAKDNGCHALVATIDLHVGNPHNTLIAALKTGFKIYKANNDVLIIAIKFGSK
jgi:predicted GNAT family acetyltransferase